MNTRDVALLVLLAAAPTTAAAQRTAENAPPLPCTTPVSTTRPGDAPAAEPPLDRQFTLHAGTVTLRDAIARIAAAAGVRIAYSGDHLALDRRVCADFDRVPLGAALRMLLGDAAVEPVIVAPDHVVLALRSTAAADPARAIRDDPARDTGTDGGIDVVPLEPLHARGDGQRIAASPRATAASTFIEGAALARRGGSVADALNGAVPGLWLWEGGPGRAATFGSVRGAASFEARAPKVYVDGIELANPMLLSRIPAESVEWIEVITGPQGAALYGADAMAGVIAIRTRHDAPDHGSALRVNSGFGLSATDYAPGSALAQGHGIGVAAASRTASASLDIATTSLGDYAPGAATRDISADLSGRLTGARGTATATARFLSVDGSPATLLAPAAAATPGVQDLAHAGGSIRQFTAGVTASGPAADRWVHSATAGLDTYRDEGSAIRGTLRIASAGMFTPHDVVRSRLTVAVDHSVLRRTPDTGSGQAAEASANTGLSIRSDVDATDRLSISAGLRLDHDGGLLPSGRLAALPAASMAWTAIATAPVDVTMRAAWGRAIRWTAPRPGSYFDGRTGAPVPLRLLDAAPEQQTGTEAGVDIRIGSVLDIGLTRFDQSAEVLSRGTGTRAPLSGGSPTALVHRDVGRIDNRGWEVRARVQAGRLAAAGTWSSIDSRVGRVAPDYTGELRPGDRMLDVPARTLGLSAAWLADRWQASVSVARAADWIGYDRAALADLTDLAYSRAAGAGFDGAAAIPGTRTVRTLEADAGTGTFTPRGIDLRDYWIEYPGFTSVAASLSRTILPGIRLDLSVDNLLNVQTGRPDNLTISPGRTITLGASATLDALRR